MGLSEGSQRWHLMRMTLGCFLPYPVVPCPHGEVPKAGPLLAAVLHPPLAGDGEQLSPVLPN